MRRYPRGATEEVVEAVVAKERIQGIFRETPRHLVRVDRAVVVRMAGATGAAVAAEGFMVEEPLAFADFSSGQCQRERRDKQAENRVPRSNEPDDDEDGEQREFCGPAWHDVPPAFGRHAHGNSRTLRKSQAYGRVSSPFVQESIERAR